MRLVTGKISHESNTFSVIPTDLEAFRRRGYHCGEDILSAFADTNTPLGGFIDGARERGVQLLPTVAADATPAGPVTRSALDTLLAQLLDGIRKSGNPDGILLQLHGAMVTEDSEDGEGEILAAIREEVGEDLPIVATLDLHGNVTERMVSAATALIGYDTNPHVDGRARGREALDCMWRIVRGEIEPVMVRSQPPIMPHPLRVRTDTGPLVDLLNIARSWEEEPGILDVSVFGGWPHVDVRDAGLSFLALTDADERLARTAVEELSEEALCQLEEFRPQTLVDLDEAVERAVGASSGPVILAEIGDSPAGGSSGDGTHTLRALLSAGADDVAILVKDPEAVAAAEDAGVRGSFSMRVGGKTDDLHGEPTHLAGAVRALTDGIYVNRGPMSTGVTVDVGRTAVIRTGQRFDVVLTERRISPVDPQVFRQAGVDPAQKRIVVLKSGGHFRAAYTDMAAEILDVDVPGVTAADLTSFGYSAVRRPVFPLDEDI